MSKLSVFEELFNLFLELTLRILILIVLIIQSKKSGKTIRINIIKKSEISKVLNFDKC